MKNALILFISFLATYCFCQNAVSINEIKLNATFQHISCHVDISGDNNLNSSLTIEYKPKSSSTYKAGAETMRAFPSMIVDGSSLGMNFLAGSAMFLEANTLYDIRLILTDPDGGDETVDLEIMTKEYPEFPSRGNTISVSPTQSSSAIQTIIDNAVNGDIIEFEDGTYPPFHINNDSIFLRSKTLHGATIDGGGTSTGVITIGVYNDSIRNVMISGFMITNGRWGVDAQNTQFLTIQNCHFHDVSYGIVNRRANGWEHDQYITNNLLIGRTPWPQTNGAIPGERGIDLRGNNNVVSFNSISNFGDGISTDGPPYRSSYSMDIYNNDCNKIVDDLIEVDGMISNSRIYNNRAFNGRAGVSLAPVFGGPAYVFRNQFVNMEYSTYKMNRGPAGLYIVHNTTVQEGDGMSSDAGWQNTIMKNNLVLSGFYCFQEYGIVPGSSDDWDYNGYYSARGGTSGSPWFKWDNIRYAKLPELSAATTIETNGLEIGLSDLAMVSIPGSPFSEFLPSSLDLQPVNNSDLINHGLQLANINQPFVSDGLPDLGAFEFGSAPTIYGHNFDNPCGNTAGSQITWNGSISDSWTDFKNWTPCGLPTEETKVIIPRSAFRLPNIRSTIKISELWVGNDQIDR